MILENTVCQPNAHTYIYSPQKFTQKECHITHIFTIKARVYNNSMRKMEGVKAHKDLKTTLMDVSQ